MAIKLEGGGVKAWMTWPLVEELFFEASLNNIKKRIICSYRLGKGWSPPGYGSGWPELRPAWAVSCNKYLILVFNKYLINLIVS